jgi:hypothetical protein
MDILLIHSLYQMFLNEGFIARLASLANASRRYLDTATQGGDFKTKSHALLPLGVLQPLDSRQAVRQCKRCSLRLGKNSFTPNAWQGERGKERFCFVCRAANISEVRGSSNKVKDKKETIR